MPNHITNILTAHGDKKKVRAMFETIKNDEIGIGSIDFNKITPMPEHIYRGNLGREEIEKYGAENCWYDWSLKNWGTKWNCYGFDEHTAEYFDGSAVKFLTAWSSVSDLMKKLSSMFPDIRFDYKWADEDFGYNTGKAEFKGGKTLIYFTPEGGSAEALELAASILDIDLAEAGYLYNESTGEYEYMEDEPDETPQMGGV
ncbi:MAG: hypothetical protein ACOY35_04230 [Bacillota bacterium]|uniref:YubB ferredoxin-like domain-containing protein n=1 Tax=Desulforamulus putei DSM 12395 TaxID=1121429 RepID=A0A1M5BFR3_9FIRM|nr:hypothetical protein [Desulforamulus putei]SHF41306.1 hypothetical protein SAMN02745133_02583 [Desulforamulus putei DSM 12395]